MTTFLPANTTEYQAQQYFQKWHDQHVQVMRRVENNPKLKAAIAKLNPQEKAALAVAKKKNPGIWADIIGGLAGGAGYAAAAALVSAQLDKLKKKVSKKKNPLQLVTPALAKRWLATNKNRKDMVPARINSMATKMKAGTYTAQTPLLFKNGKLIDGRHRLSAVVQSGKSVRFNIERVFTEKTRSEMMKKGPGSERKQKNPNDGRIYKDFTGLESTKVTRGYFVPENEPTNIDELGQLTEVVLESGQILRFPRPVKRNGKDKLLFDRSPSIMRNGKVSPLRRHERVYFVSNPTMLCGKELPGGQRRLVLAQREPFFLPNGVKRHNFKQAVQLTYLQKKPHLYEGDMKVYPHYHDLGEEGGRKPDLVFKDGWLRFVGGDQKIHREGIRD